MTLLPLVARELRVAARQPATRRTRQWVALIGILVLAGPALLAYGLSGNGRVAFTTLTVGSFLLCLLSGALLTADSLSQEKREGTLGLLFLTDLTGFDVVAGKFVARSLKAIQGLLALFPLMGLAVVMGGVTGQEVFQTSLALLQALFFSVAAGLFVSSCSRDATSALGYTLGLVCLFTAVLPGFWDISRFLNAPAWLQFVPDASPWRAFSLAKDAGGGRFWPAILASHGCAWAMLWGAGLILPRSWQERARGGRRLEPLARPTPHAARTPPEPPGKDAWKPVPRTRAGRNHQFIDINPVWWLIGGRGNFRALAWIIVVLAAALTLGAIFSGYSSTTASSPNPTARFGAFLLKLLVIFHACSFFAESRRTGAIELLVTTPLTNADIIRGQWLALRHAFLLPAAVLFLLGVFPFGSFSLFWGGEVALAGNWIAPLAFGLDLAADLAACGWAGMWFALSLRRPANAPLLTILLVLILPSVLICGLEIVPSVIIALWARARLRTDFRLTSSRNA